jgi:hypothetical protein
MACGIVSRFSMPWPHKILPMTKYDYVAISVLTVLLLSAAAQYFL